MDLEEDSFESPQEEADLGALFESVYVKDKRVQHIGFHETLEEASDAFDAAMFALWGNR